MFTCVPLAYRHLGWFFRTFPRYKMVVHYGFTKCVSLIFVLTGRMMNPIQKGDTQLMDAPLWGSRYTSDTLLYLGIWELIRRPITTFVLSSKQFADYMWPTCGSERIFDRLIYVIPSLSRPAMKEHSYSKCFVNRTKTRSVWLYVNNIPCSLLWPGSVIRGMVPYAVVYVFQMEWFLSSIWIRIALRPISVNGTILTDIDVKYLFYYSNRLNRKKFYFLVMWRWHDVCWLEHIKQRI